MITRRMALSIVTIVILTSIVVYSADAAGIPKKAISTVSRFIESDLPTTTLFTDVQNTITSIQQFTTTSAVFENPAKTFGTTLSGGAVTANRTLNLPVITGTDTVATLALAQTFTGAQTINSLILGGDVNVGSNSLTTSGHKSTLPSNTGTLLQQNGTGAYLTNNVRGVTTGTGITVNGSTGTVQVTNAGVTSATGTANNVTVSASTGGVTWNLGSNVVTTGGSAQIITKNVTMYNPRINGESLNFTKITTSPKTIDYRADTIIVDASSANPTIINLPTAVGHQGKVYNFQKNDTSGNTVMIDPSGSEKINGALNLNLTSNLGSARLQSDGTNWARIDRTADEQNSYRETGTSAATRWYGTATTALASGTIAWSVGKANKIEAYPFVVPKTITIDTIEVELTVAGNPNTNHCHVGIYTEDGNTYPYKLVTEGDLGTLSTGVKTISLSPQKTLLSGLYFLGIDCETFATTYPTFRGVAVGAVPLVLGYTSTMGGSQSGTGWVVAFTETGGVALPSQYPAGGTVEVNVIPAMILVRITG